MKIAVTSNDGQHIDTYHGNAELIYVYDVEGFEIISVEKRKTEWYYDQRRKHKLNGSAFERIYETIKDCKVFVTQNIDTIPVYRFNLLGINVKQSEGEIKASSLFNTFSMYHE